MLKQINFGFVFLLLNIIYCSSQVTEISGNPKEELVKILNENKILMLADFGHHRAEPYYSLLRVLDKFFQTNNPEKINLIMEFDSTYAIRLNRFLKHGRVDSLFDIYYEANLEDLEFWTVLKNFKDWLEEKSNKKDLICIRGFEMPVSEEFYNLSSREVDLWYVHKRDSITASGIINFIQNNPNDKVLIFYGNAHLLDSLQSKKTYTLPVEESVGYYLVHYLREKYGSENVVTVNQAYADSIVFANPVLEKYKNDVLIKKDALLNIGELHHGNFDYTIIRRNLSFPPPHRLSMMFSRRGIEMAVIKLKEFEHRMSSGEISWIKSKYDEILENLYVVTGFKFNNSDDLNNWYSKNSFNGMQRLTSNEFKQFLYDYVYSEPVNFNNEKRDNLYELGFGPGIFSALILTKEQWKKDEDRIFEKVMFHNAVCVYWLGYPDEKEKAKEVLVKFSGLIFDNPMDYLTWFRKNYYMTDY